MKELVKQNTPDTPFVEIIRAADEYITFLNGIEINAPFPVEQYQTVLNSMQSAYLDLNKILTNQEVHFQGIYHPHNPVEALRARAYEALMTHATHVKLQGATPTTPPAEK